MSKVRPAKKGNPMPDNEQTEAPEPQYSEAIVSPPMSTNGPYDSTGEPEPEPQPEPEPTAETPSEPEAPQQEAPQPETPAAVGGPEEAVETVPVAAPVAEDDPSVVTDESRWPVGSLYVQNSNDQNAK